MFAGFRLMTLVSTAATVLAVANSAQALGPRRSPATSESDRPRVYRVVTPAPLRYAVSTPRVIAVAPVAPIPPEPPEPGLAPLAALAQLRFLPSSGWFGVSLRCGDCSIAEGGDVSGGAADASLRGEREAGDAVCGDGECRGGYFGMEFDL